MATIKEVAIRAGVSPTAVSRYVNKSIVLPQSTIDKIEEAIKFYDYRPNVLARRLSIGKSNAIAIIAPVIANPFFAELVEAIEDEAEQHGYSVILASTRGLKEREVSCLGKLRENQVDGVIMMTNHADDGTLADSLSNYKNVVLVDEDVPGVNLPKIFAENEEGAYTANRYIIEAGHKRIAHIGGPIGLMSTIERYQGYARAMREAGLSLDESLIFFGDYSRDHGFESIKKIHQQLSDEKQPTAILAGSDYIAIGIMQYLQGVGLDIPNDYSIVGFDDMSFSKFLSPPLTTIRQPIFEIGKAAFKALLQLMQGSKEITTTRLPLELAERKSVRYIKG